MPYTELPPSPRLAPFVRCVWTFEAESSGPAPERIVPDGRTELIVHYRAPFAEGGTLQPRVVFAGQLTRPLWLHASGPAGVVGVRFHPAGARRFLGVPLGAFNDQRVAIDTLWDGSAEPLVNAVVAARDVAGRAAAAEAFVASRIERQPPADDAVVARCADSIERQGGKVSIEELTATAGVGRRQLERRFRDVVGVGPALLASIMRFRSVFDLIEHDSARPWTEAALAAGYFDQSHFIREFRRFVGCTPTEFLDSREGLATALVAER
jgi:AraC-like DNA-binding protein